MVEFEVKVSGGCVKGVIQGNGEPPLIFLHGGPGDTCDYMKRMAGPIDLGLTRVFFDQRGCGSSTPFPLQPEHFSIPRLVGDIEAIVTELKLRKSVLVGHSWGAMYALYASLLLPNLFRKAILINMGPLDSNFAQGAHENMMSCLTAAEQKLWSALVLERKKAMELGQTQSVFEIDRELMVLRANVWIWQPHRRAQFLEEYFRDPPVNRQVNSLVWPQAMSWFDWSNVSKLQIPVEIVNGEHNYLPREQISKLESLSPFTKSHWIRDCGHVPWADQPDEFYKLLNCLLE